VFSLWFTLCEWYPISLFWIIQLTPFEKCIWDTSVLEFSNAYFCRCAYVYMAGNGMWLDIKTSFWRSYFSVLGTGLIGS
jgi:hypothetical protein